MRFSLNTIGLYPGLSFAEIFPRMRESGFDLFELWSLGKTDVPALQAAMARSGARLSAFCPECFVLNDPARREEYLGFGPAAHSDFGGVRTANAADLPAYLAGSLPAARETPGREERMNEYVMLRMRLCAGLDTRAFAARFGTGAGRFCAALERYAAGGFVRRTASGPAFTPEGMLVSNTILSEVLDFNA